MRVDNIRLLPYTNKNFTKTANNRNRFERFKALPVTDTISFGNTTPEKSPYDIFIKDYYDAFHVDENSKKEKVFLGFSELDICRMALDYAQLDETEKPIYMKGFNHIQYSYLPQFVKLNKAERASCLEVMPIVNLTGEFIDSAFDYAKFDKGQKEICKNRLKGGDNLEEAVYYTQLNEAQRKSYLSKKEELRKTSSALFEIPEYMIFKYAKLNEEQKRVCEEQEDVLGTTMAIIYAEFSETQRKGFMAGEAMGLNDGGAISYAEFNDEQKQAFDEGKIIKGLDNYPALVYAELNGEQKQAFDKARREKRFNDSMALDYAKLTPEQRDGFDEGLSKGLDSDNALDYAKLNESQRKIYLQAPENWPPYFPYYYALAHTR